MPTAIALRAANLALAEWWFFGSQYRNGEGGTYQIHQESGNVGTAADEDTPGYEQRTWTYFKLGVFPNPNDNGWVQHKEAHWSAAFISFCMRYAGAANRFPYSIRHSDYVTEAVRNRDNGISENAISAYDKSEIAPEVGDLLLHGAKDSFTQNWTHANVVEWVRQGKGPFPSHCDIVVRVDRQDRKLYVIGGNVGPEDHPTVLRQRSELKANGKLGQSRYITVIRNRIGSSAFTGVSFLALLAMCGLAGFGLSKLRSPSRGPRG